MVTNNPLWSGFGNMVPTPTAATNTKPKFDPLAEGAVPFDPIAEGAVPMEATTPVQEDTRGGFQKTVEGIGSIAGLDIIGKKIAGMIAPAFTDAETNKYMKDVIKKEDPTWGQVAGAGLKLASTIVPAGKLVGAANVFKAGALSGGAYGLGQGLVDKQSLPDAMGTAAGYALAGGVINQLGSYVIERLPKALSIFSGENSGTIAKALENPKAADLGIKGGDEALRTAITKGAEQSVKIRADFMLAEKEAIKELGRTVTKVPYSKKGALTVVDTVLAENNVSKVGRALKFGQSHAQVNPGEVEKIKQARGIVKGWKDWSLEGTHKLKQLVGELGKFPKEGGGTAKSPVLGRVYHNLDAWIKDGLSGQSKTAYSKINADFTGQIDLFDDMVKAFNSGDPFSRIATSLSNNKDSLRKILEFYESQSKEAIMPIVAGRELATEKTSGGMMGQGFGFRNFLDFFISPQLQGRGITRVGKTQNSLSKFLPTVSKQAGTVANQQILNTFLRKPNNE